MPTPKATTRLLDSLCVDMGFCLPPDDRARLIHDAPSTEREFTDEVFEAEGLDPAVVDRQLYREVLARVRVAYCEDEEGRE